MSAFTAKITSILLLLLPCLLTAQVTIKITSIPDNTPMPSNIYIAGNFNNWNPGDPNFRLSNIGGGQYEITFTPSTNPLEFKFTRGSWNTVEGTVGGTFIPNRQFNYSGGQQTVELTILGWEDNGGGTNSTAAENVSILSDDFEIPQLNRTRRIWIYLPPNYETVPDSFPVMYMHDGQNLFDLTTSFAGEWEVDESLNHLFNNGDKGIIVVGIDNGGSHRIDEYTPWSNAQYGGGEGEAYVNFIIETLKPYIDTHYRTKTDRHHTGIMGSSLGGLISFYAAIKHQDIFGKVGVFSPSFWFSNEIYTLVEETGKQMEMRVYLLAGEQESTSMVPNLQSMYTTLIDAGFTDSEVKIITHADGQHSEWYWRREFADAYLWLFEETINATPFTFTNEDISISPNPIGDSIHIQADKSLAGTLVSIYDLKGHLLLKKKLKSDGDIIKNQLPKGIFFLKISKNGQLLYSEKIVK